MLYSVFITQPIYHLKVLEWKYKSHVQAATKVIVRGHLSQPDQDYIYPVAVCSFEPSKSLLILTCSSLSFRVEVLILTIHIFIHASFPP